MQEDVYTVYSTYSIKIKENSSTYFAYIYRIDSKKDMNYRLNMLKKEHPSSSHICYGYRYFNKNIFYEFSSDAGEPSGTAGSSILNSLRSYNIVNIVLFVIRYFGGRKLGISGLIEVYTKSSELLIEQSNVIKWYDTQKYIIEFNYSLEKIIFSTLKKEKINIIEKKFDKNIKFLVDFPKDRVEKIKQILEQKTNGNILILKKSIS